MQCPIDSSDLVMTDRQGIEIDYCPKCRGIWLDRGELDKIIERGAAISPAAPTQQPNRESDYPAQQYNKHDSTAGHGQAYPRKKRKESFLGELFDF